MKERKRSICRTHSPTSVLFFADIQEEEIEEVFCSSASCCESSSTSRTEEQCNYEDVAWTCYQECVDNSNDEILSPFERPDKYLEEKDDAENDYEDSTVSWSCALASIEPQKTEILSPFERPSIYLEQVDSEYEDSAASWWSCNENCDTDGDEILSPFERPGNFFKKSEKKDALTNWRREQYKRFSASQVSWRSIRGRSKKDVLKEVEEIEVQVHTVYEESYCEINSLRRNLRKKAHSLRVDNDMKIKMLDRRRYPSCDNQNTAVRKEIAELVRESVEIKASMDEFAGMVEELKEENKRVERETERINKEAEKLKLFITKKTKENAKLERQKRKLLAELGPKAVRQLRAANNGVKEEMRMKKEYLKCMRKIVKDKRAFGLIESDFLSHELGSMLNSWQKSTKSLGSITGPSKIGSPVTNKSTLIDLSSPSSTRILRHSLVVSSAA